MLAAIFTLFGSAPPASAPPSARPSAGSSAARRGSRAGNWRPPPLCGLTPRPARQISGTRSAELPTRRCGDRLSWTRARRADRTGARLCLQCRGQLGPAGLGRIPQGRRPPRHRARQSRPRRLHQAVRSGRLSQRADGGRRRGAARSSRSRVRRRHGLFHGGADHRVPRPAASAAAAQRRFRRPRDPSHRRDRGSGRCGAGAGSALARGGERALRRACSGPLRSRPGPTCGRSRPASAARARP